MMIDGIRNRYLPDFLKDFHDQKDLFKLIDKTIVSKKRNGESVINYPNWVAAHIYTIDIFLWVMDFYGYKLQKIRGRKIIPSLQKDIDEMKKQEAKQFINILKSTKAQK